MIGSLKAEFIKLRSSKVVWILVVAAILTIAFVFIGHFLDANNAVRLNSNPWTKYANASLSIYAFFVITILVLILTSYLIYFEHKADGWKFIYSMPVSRGSIYLSKIGVLLLLLFSSLLTMLFLMWVSGNILNLFLPEYEFNYFQPRWGVIFEKGIRILISTLGILGIQFFLSYRFRNYIIPFGVGIFGLVFGFIFTSINKSFILFFPFSYPMIAQEFEAFPTDFRSYPFDGFLSNVEYLSIAVFLLFLIFGYLMERKRQIV